jgi:DNA modification methylase
VIPDLTVEPWPVDRPQPYAANPRKNAGAVAKVVASLQEYGFRQPIVVDEAGVVIVGHTRLLAAKALGLETVPVHVATGLTPAQVRAYRIADNRTAEEAEWDDALLTDELLALQEVDFDLALTGFDSDEIADLLATPLVEGGDPDEVPEAPRAPITQRGDRIVLESHVLMCGDSTDPMDVEKLMGGTVAALLHADPPYGMGKQADGVLNDNIYGDKLDAFQMAWWSAFRPSLANNGSAYIWGNAPDLWRLWLVGGLAASEKLSLRNEIVWDKKNIAGMASPDLTQYPEASERCLFFQVGNQFLGNVNSCDFPESWEPLRASLATEAENAGIGAKEIQRVCGVGMFSHWFTRSQFTLIPKVQYAKLAGAYPGHFAAPWESLKREWDVVKGGPTSEVQGARSYFNNAHETMRDVWEFPRVLGEERHGHATPKPVAMMERVMLSSLPVGGVCAEPFGGSGSTLIAAERTRRVCYTMELSPAYCDVIVTRWETATGKTAVRP